MTEHDWLTSTNPRAMLEFLPEVWAFRTETSFPSPATARKLRLFAVACCYQVWDQLTDPRSRRAVEVAERYADGLASKGELTEAYYDIPGMGRKPINDLTLSVRWCSTPWEGYDGARIALEVMRRCGVPTATQAALLRCLFGNPWRPVAVYGGEIGTYPPPHATLIYQPDLARWLTPPVLTLARAIYDERRWEDVPILADALEEAECTDAAILAHLRSPGTHARGCHVVDAILGKE